MTPPRHHAIVLTPPGTGAIAIIRLIGPDPLSILKNSFVHSKSRVPQPDGKLLYGRLMDGPEILDDVLVSMEMVTELEQAVEISCHGGIRVVQRILELLERGGATVDTEQLSTLSYWPAQNKIEEEAIEALACAKTQRAARYAALLRTELPSKIRDILQQCETNPAQARLSLGKLMLGYGAATALLRGITVALIGPPNSGKSTLFNALLGRQAVVTSPVPGTTRDWVMESVEFQGVPINLVDTAGRRETDCELEQLAIEAGDSLLHKSSAVLIVLDGSIPQTAFDFLSAKTRKFWVVANKTDLGFCWKASDLARIKQASGSYPLPVSAKTGTGCEMLRHAVLDYFWLFNPADPPPSFFTDRQALLASELSNPATDFRQILASLLGDKLAEPAGKAL